MDTDGVMYGFDRMVDVLRSTSDSPLDASLQTLRTDIENFRNGEPAQDDRTILAVRRSDS